ncbi:MAG: putative ABC transporter permease [Lachnospiraceae bacterium]|nr:putative ABC transporter permease [Lachnospiraceae bacterium]
MTMLLQLAFLFFMGSVIGWGLEVLFRRFVSYTNPERKWINPGFCTGPYLPLYGFCLCALYLIASLENMIPIERSFWNKTVLFLVMTACMTLIEYISGVFALKILKVRLWDYSNEWGNLQGIICPRFSAIWAILGAVYYFMIHPFIKTALIWLSHNLTFSFFIGMFFGVFFIDVAHSAQLVAKLKKFAEENNVIVRYETFKEGIRTSYTASAKKYRFFRPLHSNRPLPDILKDIRDSFEHRKKN